MNFTTTRQRRNVGTLRRTGSTAYDDGSARGIRPVITLKAGTKVAGGNSGTGASEDKAYLLGHSKYENTDETQHINNKYCLVCNQVGESVLEEHTWDGGVVTKEANCTEKGVRTFKCDDCGATKTEEIPINMEVHPELGEKYLIDQVEIGDYIDIGIPYFNTVVYSSGNTVESLSKRTGWRVLSKTGSGESGVVTLVSAGTPLSYEITTTTLSDVQQSINNLSDLNKIITIDPSAAYGFTNNGFNSTNLSDIWASNRHINATTAHTMTTGEIAAAYKAITGESYSISTGSYTMRTSNMKTVAEGNGLVWSEKANDLLGIGRTYALGSSYYTNRKFNYSSKKYEYFYYLYLVKGYGGVTYKAGDYGVRPVISLNSGVQVAMNNIGTGASESDAYKLADYAAIIEYTNLNDTQHTKTIKCSACNVTIEHVTENHTWDDGVIITEPTCTDEGETIYTCTGCGHSYSDYTEATGHSYSETAREDATCDTNGYTEYSCANCGDSYTEEIPATGHSYSETAREDATCDTDGYIEYSCANCGDSYTDYIEATGHDYSESAREDATCDTEGYVEYSCANCGDSYTVELPTTEHNYSETGSQEPTCTEEGYIEYSCSNCGDSYTDYIASTGHSDEDGDEYCDVCGEYIGGTVEEEIKLYFDTPYTVTYIENEQEKKEHYIFKENGAVEGYITGQDGDVYLKGFPNMEMFLPEGTAIYEGNTISAPSLGMSATVSDDGLTVTMNGIDFVCTFEEYHDTWFDTMYIAKTSDYIDAKFYEDGSVITSEGVTFPAGTCVRTGSHKGTFAGMEFWVSMDGKSVYDAASGTLIYAIEDKYALKFDTPYSFTQIINEQEEISYFVFKENGEIEVYVTNLANGDEGKPVQFFPEGTAIYGDKSVTMNGETATVSDDGLSITYGDQTYVCTSKEYHDTWFDTMYIAKTENYVDAKFYEDGSVITSEGVTFPAGTCELTGSHQGTFAGGEFWVSMNGKRVYDKASGELIYEIENYYGFYFDTPYSYTTTMTDDNGQEQEIKMSYVFKEDGTLEMYASGYIDETTYVDGVLNDIWSGIIYGEKTADLDPGDANPMIMTFSEDGLSGTVDGTTFVCTFEEYHDVWFDTMYTDKTGTYGDAKFYEDGSLITSDGTTFPAGTVTYTGSHTATFNSMDFLVSMDGKRIYSAADGTLIFEIEEGGDDTCTEHSYTETARQDATCEDAGYIEYTCDNCGDTYTETLEATGHTWSNVVAEEYYILGPTCEVPATYYESCSDCGATGEGTFTDGDKGEHLFDYRGADPEANLRSAATCKEAATYWVRCQYCGLCSETEYFSSGEVATEHTGPIGYGNTREVCTYCTLCGATISQHSSFDGWEVCETVVANCQQSGYKVLACPTEGCSYTIIDADSLVDKTDHNLVKDTSNPNYIEKTCTTNGYIIWKCTTEGCDYTNEITEYATGHTRGTWIRKVSDATCEQPEQSEYNCSVCGETFIAGSASALGHVWVTNGIYDEEYCSRCLINKSEEPDG